MNAIDMFLVQYGLAAVFVVMLAKSIGVPIPIPGDVIILATAVRAAQGKLILWQAFLAILVALVLGGIIQFVLVRGPGRSLARRNLPCLPGIIYCEPAPPSHSRGDGLRRRRMPTTFRLNPERVAYFETNGWRAYYDRKWLKVLWLIVRLCQEQFHIPFPMSLLAAYYTTRASAAWAPVDHNLPRVLANLTRFYTIARRYSGLKFNVERVSALELQYFDVHRRLVDATDKSEFVQTLVDLHSAIFGLTPAQVRESAEWRVKAADTVDLITSKKSTDVQGDWARLEEYLSQCYTSIQREL